MMVRNPFAHSDCTHEELSFPVAITDTFEVDLLNVFGHLWEYCITDNNTDALIMLETLGEWIDKSLLGLASEVDEEVAMYRSYGQELKTLHDDEEFDDEVRRLLGDQ